MVIQTSGEVITAQELKELNFHKYESLQQSSSYLRWVMYASLINLLFPINTLMEWFFLK